MSLIFFVSAFLIMEIVNENKWALLRSIRENK